jgi:hypothetical protein
LPKQQQQTQSGSSRRYAHRSALLSYSDRCDSIMTIHGRHSLCPVLAVRIAPVVRSVDFNIRQHSAFSSSDWSCVCESIPRGAQLGRNFFLIVICGVESRSTVNKRSFERAAVAIKVQLAFDGCSTVEAGDWRWELCTKPIPELSRINRDEVHPSRETIDDRF